MRAFFLGGTVITANLYIWHLKLLPHFIKYVNRVVPISTKYPNVTSIIIDQTFFPASICFSYLWFVSFFEVDIFLLKLFIVLY
jgi:hypothetical protein